MPSVFVIHGIGPVAQQDIEKRMKAVFGTIECLNWDHRFPLTGFNQPSKSGLRRFFGRVGRAVVACTSLGFNGAIPYCGIPPSASRIHNVLALSLLILSVVFVGGYFPVWLALLALVPLDRETWIAAGLLYVTTRSAMVVSLLISLAMIAIGLRYGGPKGGWASLRRALLAAWPIVPATMMVALAACTWYCLIAPTMYLSDLILQIYPKTGGPGMGIPLWVDLLGALPRFTGLLAFGSIVVWALFPTVYLLKLFSDVALYAGDVEYRSRLGNYIESSLVSADALRLIVVSHSLGTVIAADAFMHAPQAFDRFHVIEWVTMGSPIDRLFARLFPQIYPGSPQISAFLADVLPGLRWTHIYSPLDFVGGALRFATGSSREQVCTGAYRSPLASHTGYWEDPVVLRTLRSVTTRADGPLVKERPPHCAKIEVWPSALTDPQPSRYFARNSWVPWTLALGVTIGVALLAHAIAVEWPNPRALLIAISVVLCAFLGLWFRTLLGQDAVIPLVENFTAFAPAGSFWRLPNQGMLLLCLPYLVLAVVIVSVAWSFDVSLGQWPVNLKMRLFG